MSVCLTVLGHSKARTRCAGSRCGMEGPVVFFTHLFLGDSSIGLQYYRLGRGSCQLLSISNG